MSSQRANYNAIKAEYNARGMSKVRLTQSTLLLSAAISTTSTSYQFNVLDNQGTIQSNEIRLNINDEFTVTHVGLFLQGVANTGATKLLSYAPFEVDATKAATLQPLFDGTLRMAVNNIVYIDKWDTRKHEIVPQTQHAAFVAATAAIGSTPARIAEFASKDFMYPLDPMITLSGAKKNEITLNLPSAMTGQTFTVASNTGTYSVVVDRIALMLRGLNAQNASGFQGVKA